MFIQGLNGGTCFINWKSTGGYGQVTDVKILRAPEAHVLYPDRCNIHELRAGENQVCAVLDVITPDYDVNRPCKWTRIRMLLLLPNSCWCQRYILWHSNKLLRRWCRGRSCARSTGCFEAKRLLLLIESMHVCEVAKEEIHEFRTRMTLSELTSDIKP